MMEIAITRTFGLYFATAIAELVGCYLPLLWLTGKGSVWLLAPATLSLVIFVWLLTLHPAEAGRVYAMYGAVYIATALGWLWLVDGVRPTWTDMVGVALALCGAGVIALDSARRERLTFASVLGWPLRRRVIARVVAARQS